MKAVILAPWRGGDPDRERSWAIVQEHFGQLGLGPIYTGDSEPEVGGGKFSTARAMNVAFAAATASVPDWDVALQVCADCVNDLDVIIAAMGHAYRSGFVTLPHDDFYSVSKEGHRRGVDAANPFDDEFDGRVHPEWVKWSEDMPHPLYTPSGVMVVPRVAWQKIEALTAKHNPAQDGGGYDERQRGWGFEDAAFLVTASAACGQFDRMAGVMYHFWHHKRGGPGGLNGEAWQIWHDEYAYRGYNQWFHSLDPAIPGVWLDRAAR